MLTTEAAQAEIINKDFTSPGTVLPLPSFDQSVQRLPQHSPGKHKQRESPLCPILIMGKVQGPNWHGIKSLAIQNSSLELS